MDEFLNAIEDGTPPTNNEPESETDNLPENP